MNVVNKWIVPLWGWQLRFCLRIGFLCGLWGLCVRLCVFDKFYPLLKRQLIQSLNFCFTVEIFQTVFNFSNWLLLINHYYGVSICKYFEIYWNWKLLKFPGWPFFETINKTINVSRKSKKMILPSQQNYLAKTSKTFLVFLLKSLQRVVEGFWSQKMKLHKKFLRSSMGHKSLWSWILYPKHHRTFFLLKANGNYGIFVVLLGPKDVIWDQVFESSYLWYQKCHTTTHVLRMVFKKQPCWSF